MHASKILFTSLSLLAGLAAAQGVPGGDICCSDAQSAPAGTCTSGKTAFCCDLSTNADIGSGCDNNKDFPNGKAFNGISSTSCTSGGSSGTFMCV
ncbi:hypothetical protein CSUB01_12168 [Colletotrichum sublineola]|uniref:Uncharacterized protein n=1 Tax=Colletotrichum sublineola TaxID=1173701 RepID=A0A066XQS0_COLSU|nr:hypothetical protein CSUB01_12168 [Colletotrichum sublineola]